MILNKRVRQNCRSFHSEFQPFVEMPTMKSSTFHVFLKAGLVNLLDVIVATVSVPAAVHIFVIALLGWETCWSPQHFTLIEMRTAWALVAQRLFSVAFQTVLLEHVNRTEFVVTIAILRQVALSRWFTTTFASRMKLASCKITAWTGSTSCITMEHAGVWIAARAVAAFRQTTIALFTIFKESVATNRSTENVAWRILEAIIHSMMEREVHLIDAARAPTRFWFFRNTRWHDAFFVRAHTIALIMVHSQSMSQVVSNSCSDDFEIFTVSHHNTSGVLICANNFSQAGGRQATREQVASQQSSCVVMRILFDKISHAVVQKVFEGIRRILCNFDQVAYRPNDDIRQNNKHV